MSNAIEPNDSIFEGQEIIFPVSYVLKVVVTQNMSPERHGTLIEELLNKKNIPYRFEEVKESAKKTYLSFSISITLTDKNQMNELYNDLKTMPWIKMAL